MLDLRDVGHRVVVRSAVAEGHTDTVGHLLDLDDQSLAVLRKDGLLVEVASADVVAAKLVPPAPVRPGWEVPSISPDDLQRVCSAGWPAREQEGLGDWLLRAHGGITGRANSVMAVGDPGLPLDQALAAVRRWYDERGLPSLLQLPLTDPRNHELAELGWARKHVTVVQVAPIGQLMTVLPDRDDLTSTVTPEPTPSWRALMHDLDTDDPELHLRILAGPALVGFVTVARGGEPVGIGRVSVEGAWAGVTSVDVAPASRRQGIGKAVMRALVAWAAQQGADSTYLQVRAKNDAALRLYGALGYRTHHPYNYREPRPSYAG